MSQNKNSYFLKDELSKEPIPYANILFDGSLNGTTSAMNGEFWVDKNVGAIKISSLGYEEKNVSTGDLANSEIIYLKSIDFILSEVIVVPGKNPAIEVLDDVWNNRYKVSIESQKHSLLAYNKLNFHLLTQDTIGVSIDFLSDKPFTQENPILIMESIEKKLHIPEKKKYSEIISSRVSGFKDASLAVVATKIQSLSFFDDKIDLLNSELLNPLSPKFRDKYYYNLKDTIIDKNGDKLLYITFKPQKDKDDLIYGSFFVDFNDKALKTISFTTIKNRKPFFLSARQNLKKIENNLWALDDLETYLILDATGLGQNFKFRVFGRSIFTDEDFETELSPKDFRNFAIIDNSFSPDIVDKCRKVELTKTERDYYAEIDSLSKIYHYDYLLNLQKEILKGYIPLGYLSLEMDKFFGVNQHEGLRLGAGLKSNTSLSEAVFFDGFYTRSLKSKTNNFGGGVTLKINDIREQSVRLQSFKSKDRVGEFSFLDGYGQLSNEAFSKIASTTMDNVNHYSIDFKSRIINNLKAEMFFGFENRTSSSELPFLQSSQFTNYKYEKLTSSVKIKWQPKAKFIFTKDGISEINGSFPIIWANYSFNLIDKKSEYHKTEFQLEHHFPLFKKVNATVRSVTGITFGNMDIHSLYSDFGSYLNFGIESDFSFKTMRPNEFAASKFSLLFAKISLPAFFETKYFAPSLVLLSSTGFGDNYSNEVNTFEKGYFESGIRLNSILKTGLVNYGFGVHYRYGEYSRASTIDNFSFNLGIEFTF